MVNQIFPAPMRMRYQTAPLSCRINWVDDGRDVSYRNCGAVLSVVDGVPCHPAI